MLKSQEYRCEYCRIHFDNDILPTIDHKIPLISNKTTNHISNLVASCESCNNKKGDTEYNIFKERLKIEKELNIDLFNNKTYFPFMELCTKNNFKISQNGKMIEILDICNKKSIGLIKDIPLMKYNIKDLEKFYSIIKTINDKPRKTTKI